MSTEESFVDLSDYQAHANLLKTEGNEAFQSGDNDRAISLYTQGINLDPDNHVLYSNRSAAYMKADSKSKALHDAEKCVELAPKWVKGYNRLGVAQQSLRRFEAAIDTFKKGLEIDPNDQALWAAMRSCQEAQNEDRKVRFAEEAKKREEEEARLRRREEMREAALAKTHAVSKKKSEEDDLKDLLSSADKGTSASSRVELQSAPSVEIPKGTNPVSDGDKEEDLLAGFLSSVGGPSNSAPTAQQGANEKIKAKPFQLETANEKYLNQDLGDAVKQVERLTAPNYQFRNLNPYFVLQLGTDATDEDIKQRYRKLSTKVHPDKLPTVENAREAFEQVKSAYQKLMDEKQREVAILNIEYVEKEVLKDRRRLLSKGMKESQLPSLEEELETRLLKHFAEIEMARRRAETNLRFYNARERIQEDEEKERLRKEAEKEEKWADLERREKRVGNWREFQEDPEAKRVRLSNFKEESRIEEKHGVVKTETWKKTWK